MLSDLEFIEILIANLQIERIMSYPKEDPDYKAKLNELIVIHDSL